MLREHTRILPPSNEHIVKAATLLLRGELVGMPTETVYGLAADSTNPEAVERVFTAKGRPPSDPLILHLSRKMYAPVGELGAVEQGATESLEAQKLVQLSSFGEEARSTLEKLVQKFWPGPLTLVLPKGEAILEAICSGGPTVALRSPQHPTAQALIAAINRPLVAPSANRFGRISPTQANHVLEELGDKVACILDGGACTLGLESTVVAVHPDASWTLLRPGMISREALEMSLLKEEVIPSTTHSVPASPGTMSSHYAPSTPATFLPAAWSSSITPHWLQQTFPKARRIGLLLFSSTWTKNVATICKDLEERGVLVAAVGTCTDADCAGRSSAKSLCHPPRPRRTRH